MGGELDARPGRGRKIGQELRIDDAIRRGGSIGSDEDEAGLDDAALPVGGCYQGVEIRIGVVQGQADLGDGIDAIDAVAFELELRMLQDNRDVGMAGEGDGLLRPVARSAILEDDIEDDERRPFSNDFSDQRSSPFALFLAFRTGMRFDYRHINPGRPTPVAMTVFMEA